MKIQCYWNTRWDSADLLHMSWYDTLQLSQFLGVHWLIGDWIPTSPCSCDIWPVLLAFWASRIPIPSRSHRDQHWVPWKWYRYCQESPVSTMWISHLQWSPVTQMGLSTNRLLRNLMLYYVFTMFWSYSLKWQTKMAWRAPISGTKQSYLSYL